MSGSGSRSINTRNVQNYEQLGGTANGVYINPLGVEISGGPNNIDALSVINQSAVTIFNVDTVASTVTINGDLTVNGTATFVETKNLEVENSMIELNKGAVAGADTRDIGFYGSYIPIATTYYAGLVRDYTDNTFKFFTGNPTQPNLVVTDLNSYLGDVGLKSLNVTDTITFKTNLSSIVRALGANANWTFAQTGSGSTIFSNGGSNTFTLSTVAASFLLPVSVPTGTSLATTLNFGTAGTGLYSSSSSTSIDFSTGGIQNSQMVAYTGFNTVRTGTFSQLVNKLVGTGSIGTAAYQGGGGGIAISADGNTLAVGGPKDNSLAGATWIFIRSGNSWAQQGDKLVGTGATGISAQGTVALSADGNTLAVGGVFDNSVRGAVWIFTRSNGVWTQQGSKLVATSISGTSTLGASVSLSGDGNVLAVAGSDLASGNVVAVWIFTRSNGVWTQQTGPLIGSGSGFASTQSFTVSLNSEGDTFATASNPDNTNVGSSWIFAKINNVWSQQAGPLIGSGAVGGGFQTIISLSADGNTFAVGGWKDNSDIGATWVFTRTNGTWTQQGSKLVGTGSTGTPNQGFSVSLSADGNTLAVGGWTDNTDVGATWIFTRTNGTWTQQGSKMIGTGSSGNPRQGNSLQLNANASVLAIGGPFDASETGATWVYTAANPGYINAAGAVISTYTGSAKFPNFCSSLDNETSGLYFPSEGTLGLSTLGSGRIVMDSSNITTYLPIILVSGSNTATALNFGTAGTGLYGTSSTVSISTSALQRLSVSDTLVALTVPLQLKASVLGSITIQAPASVTTYSLTLPDIQGSANSYLSNNGSGTLSWSSALTLNNGTVSAPSLNFANSATTGLYSSSAGTIDFSTSGIQNSQIVAYNGFNTVQNGTFLQLVSKLVGTGATGSAQQGYSVSLSSDGSTLAIGGYQDNSNIGAVWIFTRTGITWTQQGSKLTGTDVTGAAQQGFSVSLSADGNTLAMGGTVDNSKGAVWIFTRTGSTWTQQGSKLVGTGSTGSSQQGYSVALSANGNTLASGAAFDNATIGAVWIFTRTGSTWTQQGSKLVGTDYIGTPRQGVSVALSSDGNTLASGGRFDDTNVGAVWIFTRTGSTWAQQGNKLVGTVVSISSQQGFSVALSSDGNTLASGGRADNDDVGAVWIFIRTGTSWTQQGSKLIGTDATGSAQQGFSVSLSANGDMLASGGRFDNSNIGAVWIFTRTGTTWTQQGSKLAGNGTTASFQGTSVSLSSNASILASGGYIDNISLGATWVFNASNPGYINPAGALVSSYSGSSKFPALACTIDNETSGIYWPSAGNLDMSTAGTKCAGFTSAGQFELPLSHNISESINAGVQSGTWVPSFSSYVNCSAGSITGACWSKCGKVITCNVYGSLTVTSVSTLTTFILSFPLTHSGADGGGAGSLYQLSANQYNLVFLNSGTSGIQAKAYPPVNGTLYFSGIFMLVLA